MKTHGLVIDYKYCTGCHTCEVACKNEHDIPEGQWGIKLAEMGPVRLEGKWMWDYVPIPSDLCDLCADRRAAGLKAACQHHCLAQCIEVVPVESIGQRMAELGDTVTCFIP